MPPRVIDDEMRAYYDRRAPDYDDWWLGNGEFEQRERPGWEEEVDALTGIVRGLAPARVLDVACGTGFLTRHLRGDVTGLDQSEAMLAVAGERAPGVRLVNGDAVPLPFGDGEFDRLFTSHFYGHLLPGERKAFVAEARRVAGELVVVDAALREGVEPEGWPVRALADGTTYRVYKRFFSGEGLADELGGGEVLYAGRWFVVVRARRRVA
jgi:demethylmenaquinone methyltransferase/2-methoxy-6-polyprenyl-1,4-benzoquinol methylase